MPPTTPGRRAAPRTGRRSLLALARGALGAGRLPTVPALSRSWSPR